jgi:hypothetical protein
MEKLNVDKTIFKDYTEKIKNKLPDNIDAADINNLIALLNYCFQKKNNFFVKDFNKRVIKEIYLTYNKLKTNILTTDIFDLFQEIPLDNIKLLRFILINFVNNYETINENNELCIPKDSMKKCVNLLSTLLG